MDPATGAARPLTRFGRTGGPVTVATALTPGTPPAILPAGPPEPTWYTPAAIGDAWDAVAERASSTASPSSSHRPGGWSSS